MKVTLRVVPWKEDHASSKEEGEILLTQGILLNDVEYAPSRVSITVESQAGRRLSDFLTVELVGLSEEEFGRLTPSDYSMDSTPEITKILVDDIVIEYVDSGIGDVIIDERGARASAWQIAYDILKKEEKSNA